MSDAQKVIEFVDSMLIGLIVMRHEDEFTKEDTYVCECCDAEADKLDRVDHSPFCEVAKWIEFKNGFAEKVEMIT